MKGGKSLADAQQQHGHKQDDVLETCIVCQKKKFKAPWGAHYVEGRPLAGTCGVECEEQYNETHRLLDREVNQEHVA